MASRRARIARVTKALRAARLRDMTNPEVARAAVDAVGCPDLMGVKEVIVCLGVSDLRKVANLPEPVAEVEATRLWDADEIRALARERKRNPPGRWNSKQKARR